MSSSHSKKSGSSVTEIKILKCFTTMEKAIEIATQTSNEGKDIVINNK